MGPAGRDEADAPASAAGFSYPASAGPDKASMSAEVEPARRNSRLEWPSVANAAFVEWSIAIPHYGANVRF
ncbi:hypothetical protein P3T23_003239 [Paraburkholderia sp. GAS448]|uniref:hypothetical protein n=1 Tax=Paraburkholderia sp. GAS448 TaxID=3035136 RepID=UPI003D1AA765